MPQHYIVRRRTFNPFGNMSMTLQLMILNVIIYFVSIFVIFQFGEEVFIKNLALTPSLVLSGKSIWTLLTSIFVHLSLFHIFANMFSLFFVGGFLEKLIGGRRLFWIYIVSGLMGSVFFVLSGLIFNSADIPGIGASGAVFGILGVLAVVVPYSRIYLIVGPLLLLLIDVVARGFLPVEFLSGFSFVINILILLSIFALFSPNPSFRKFAVPLKLPMWVLPIIAIVPLVIIDLFVDLPIGNSAHIGGLVVGLFYGWYLKKKYPRKAKAISRHFS